MKAKCINEASCANCAEDENKEDSLHFIFRQLMRLHHYRSHMLLNSLGVHPGQPAVLFMLEHNDGISQKEIAERLKLKGATVTVMLKRMEKNGLIYRKTDARDLRVSRVYLAETGRDRIKKIKEKFKSLDEECFHGFSGEEKILLRRFLTQMRDNLAGVLQCDEASAGASNASKAGDERTDD
ncbi:MAG: MarR family transcriptional regulator [Clostridiaceae bacterium]|nr:MarR family transcriptional regulator [Clostridiaceae bacterium]